ncbi:hypothetical protein B0O99DRAFT_267239 [Bisporella sp. PMI_857]|nr:hypothetical protein B0O99DRAFT_267239 [Bisporella sp. PMI_857]
MKAAISLSFFALPSLFLLCDSLPFVPRQLEPLVRRAAYSVVPVDGGPAAATGDDGLPAPVTIKQTVTHSSPTTTTITRTEKPLPTTEYVTTSVEAPESTETLIVSVTQSVTASPRVVTTTRYSVINVIPLSTTVEIPAPLPTTSESSPSLSATSGESTPTQSLPTSSISSLISTEASFTTAIATSASSINISNISTGVLSSTATTTATYDDGQWHTTYPSWSNTTRTGGAVRRVARPTPLLV